MAMVSAVTDLFSGTRDFPNGPKARHGDLLPLPLPEDNGFSGQLGEIHSRRSQQRVSRRRKLFEDVEDSIWALNKLAGFQDSRQWPVFPRNQAQKAAVRRIAQCHSQRPPPIMHESDREALQQLLKSKGASGYSDVPEGPGQLASFVRQRLSLPRSASTSDAT